MQEATKAGDESDPCLASDACQSTVPVAAPLEACSGKANRFHHEEVLIEGVGGQSAPESLARVPPLRCMPLSWQSPKFGEQVGEPQVCKASPKELPAAEQHVRQQAERTMPPPQGSKRKSPELTASPARCRAEGGLPLAVRQRVAAVCGNETLKRHGQPDPSAVIDATLRAHQPASPSSSQQAHDFRNSRQAPSIGTPDTPISKHLENIRGCAAPLSDPSGKRDNTRLL